MTEYEHHQHPDYFKTVIVPISKPDTAMPMLQLAASLIDPEDGKVIALTVGLADAGEMTSERLESLQLILDQIDEVPHIEHVTQIASSITRGILDGAREQGAEALIIGVQTSSENEVNLGNVVENIISAAPCNVLIYRTGDAPEFERVIVPLDDNRMTPMALYVGTMIAKTHKISISTPIIQRDYTSTREKEERFRDLLDTLDEDQVGKREFIMGRTPGGRLLQQIGSEDLLILGFSQKANLELEFGRDVSDILLRRASGPVLLYSQIFEDRDTVVGTVQRYLQRFNPALTQVERNELIWGARKAALPGIDYSMLILLAAGLASLGLMANSTAVIIGAMLVAPLMSPLGALAIGMAAGELNITRRAVFTLIQGVFLALLISIVMGWLLGINVPTPEMAARGNPTLLDAGVALVSGLVAAFALARKEIPVALAGVAIAAALMPPVCTIGLGIAMNNLRLAGGASLLFLANITFIVMAQNAIFLWMGMRPGRRQETQRGVVAWWVAIIGLIVVVVALILRLGQVASEEISIEKYLLGQMTSTEFVAIDEREREDGSLSVLFTVRSPDEITPQDVSELGTNLEEHLGQIVQLDVVNLRVIEPFSDTENIVINSLETQFPDTRITEIALSQEENILLIDVTLRTENIITGDNVQQAETRLSEALEQPVRLFVIVQEVIAAPEIMPEITPEAEVTAEASE